MIETLESRRLFAVTVSEAFPGYYEVYGEDSDDVIDITVSQAGESFTLDGQAYYGVWYIYVHAGGGDDYVSVLSEDGMGFIGASVSAGDGSDTVILNFDGSIWAGDGNDVLYISDSFRGEVFGADGSDQIYISGSNVDAVIHGGEGDDFIDASANDYAASLYGDEGDDTIYGSEYNDVIDGGTGDDFVHGNGGDDVFHVRDGEPDTIFGGDGRDSVYADSVEAVIGEDVEYVYLA